MRTCVLVASLAIIVFPPTASAQGSKSAIPQDEVCERVTDASGARFKLHTGRFLRWVFDKYDVSGKCVADKDGNETFTERTNLLLTVAEDKQKQCKGDSDKLNQARNRVEDVVQGREIGFKVEVAASNPRTPEFLSAVDLLKGNSVVVVCLAVKPDRDPKEQRPEDKVEKISDLKVGGWKVKLRGDQEALEYNKENENYKKAPSAQLAYSSNKLSDRDKYNVKGAIGLDSGLAPFVTSFASGDYRIIPYVKLEEQFVRPKVKNAKSKEDKEIDVKTLGTIGTVNFRLGESRLLSKVTFDPQYIWDDETDTEIFGTTIKWYPTIWSSDGANSFPPGDVAVGNLFYYHLYLAGVARIGHVIDAGDDPTLADKNNFAYFGPEARLVLTGQKGSFLEPFKLDTRYHYLWRQSGPESVLERFTTSLTYTLDKDGNVDIGITWDSGHDYETLKERQLLTTAIGYKF